MRQILGCLLVTVFAAGAAPVAVASAESTAQEVAYGTGSVLSTLLYVPFKTTFCVVGGVTSAFTLPFAGPRTAEQVASAGCGGTWVITPGALKGQERVRFIGGSPGGQAAPSHSATTR
jgi:hypothetical protein